MLYSSLCLKIKPRVPRLVKRNWKNKKNQLRISISKLWLMQRGRSQLSESKQKSLWKDWQTNLIARFVSSWYTSLWQFSHVFILFVGAACQSGLIAFRTVLSAVRQCRQSAELAQLRRPFKCWLKKNLVSRGKPKSFTRSIRQTLTKALPISQLNHRNKRAITQMIGKIHLISKRFSIKTTLSPNNHSN